MSDVSAQLQASRVIRDVLVAGFAVLVWVIVAVELRWNVVVKGKFWVCFGQ